MFSIQERLATDPDAISGALWQWANMLRCASPGIIRSFDPDKQTCTVDVATQERVQALNATGSSSATNPVWTTINTLQDVPVVMPRAGGWAMTFPIQPGDECLLVFADACIDGWWQSGGVQPQFDRRRHDLSDAFAIFGPWSQPRRMSNYATDSLQLRSEDSSVVIDLAGGKITVTAPKVQVSSPTVNIDNGGTKLPVATKDLYDWVNADLLPALAAHSITVAPPPITSVTTVLEAE